MKIISTFNLEEYELWEETAKYFEANINIEDEEELEEFKTKVNETMETLYREGDIVLTKMTYNEKVLYCLEDMNYEQGFIFENCANKIYVACRENGDFIEEVSSIEQGETKIKYYEELDKREGVYEENFYDIVNEKHETLI